MTRLFIVRSLVASSLAAALALVAGCDSGTSHDNPASVDLGGSDAAPVGPAGDSNVIDAGTFTINPVKPDFQTKSAAQLLSSIKACFGGATLLVTADMIQGDAAAPVLPASFKPSIAVGADDIVTVQKAAFDGDPSLLRMGTRADSLTLEYVTAQRNVANVVAANCVRMAASNPLCNCASGPDATAMVRRCLPQLDPTSNDVINAAQMLQTRCASNPGQAIASFVASAALSKLP